MRFLGLARRSTPGVCHLTTSHPPTDTRILLRECRSLATAGYDVALHVVASAVAPEPGGPGPVPVTVHRFAVPGRAARLALRPWWGLMVGLRTRRRVIHLHDPEMIPMAPLFKLAGRSVVYDVHEDVPRQIAAKEWLPRPIRALVATGFEHVEDWCARRVDVVVAATDAIGERFERLHPRVLRVRNFASSDHFPPPPPAADRQWDACFVGVINTVRGSEQMLAVAERSGARTLIAGPCHPPELAARFEEVAARVPTFQFRGPVPHHEAAAIMRDSRLGLLLFQPVPNNVEAQPNKLYEYLASGTVVVGPNFPRFAQLIEGEDVGVAIDSTSADEAVAAVQELLADPDGLEDRSERARRLFERRFSWESEERELLRAYRSLPARPATTAGPLVRDPALSGGEVA